MIYDNIGQLIGNTPLVRVKFPELALQAEIVAKVESFNPGGSIKDRVAANMLYQAEADGVLQPGYSNAFGSSPSRKRKSNCESSHGSGFLMQNFAMNPLYLPTRYMTLP